MASSELDNTAPRPLGSFPAGTASRPSPPNTFSTPSLDPFHPTPLLPTVRSWVPPPVPSSSDPSPPSIFDIDLLTLMARREQSLGEEEVGWEKKVGRRVVGQGRGGRATEGAGSRWLLCCQSSDAGNHQTRLRGDRLQRHRRGAADEPQSPRRVPASSPPTRGSGQCLQCKDSAHGGGGTSCWGPARL